MNPTQRPLREAGWPWISLSLGVAALVNLAPLGNSPAVPDLLALVLAFWAVQRPARLLLPIAFVLGLVIDAHRAMHLGQHALLYTAIVVLVLQFHRRIIWFQTPGRMLHVLGLFLVAQGLLAGARWLIGLPWLGPEQFLTWLSTILLWPLIDMLLMSGRQPQRAERPAPRPARPVAPTIDDSPASSLAPRPAFRHRDDNRH